MTDKIITLTNVSASYQKVIVALQDISLSVRTGSIVALLGANGAGKTTTLKGISNLLKAEECLLFLLFGKSSVGMSAQLPP